MLKNSYPNCFGLFPAISAQFSLKVCITSRNRNKFTIYLKVQGLSRSSTLILFKTAVLVYRCLHGSAPGYLASDFQRVSHLNARRRLRSSTTSTLVVPRTVRSTIGDRTFPATAASVWNSLPESVRSFPSLQVFRSRLKTKLFAWSYSHD